jgi:hypothetical protein
MQNAGKMESQKGNREFLISQSFSLATPKTNFDLKISFSQIALAVGGQIL